MEEGEIQYEPGTAPKIKVPEVSGQAEITKKGHGRLTFKGPAAKVVEVLKRLIEKHGERATITEAASKEVGSGIEPSNN